MRSSVFFYFWEGGVSGQWTVDGGQLLLVSLFYAWCSQ
jgi:hypothetical protein